jgi:glucokinase
MYTDRDVAVSIAPGGGETTVALVDCRGRILQRCYAKMLKGRPVAATLEPFLQASDALLRWAHAGRLVVRGIGVSVPGSLDEQASRPTQIPLLPALNGFPLRDFLAARYDLPCQLHIDVDAAIVGEHRFGAGRGFQRLLFLTVSAVMGAALVVNGQVEPTSRYIGHICHIPVATSGPRCSCGKRGCINTLISMDAVQRMVQRAVQRGEETSLTQRLLNRESFSPQLFLEEARRGDSVASRIYSEVGRWLGVVITKYVDLFEPHALIVGGGSFYASELLLAHLRDSLDSKQNARVCSMIEVLPAAMGVDAALIGAVVPFFLSC